MVSLMDTNPNFQKMTSSGLISTISDRLHVFTTAQTICHDLLCQSEACKAGDKPLPTVAGNEVKAEKAHRRPYQ
jgi:hypothetical protein